MALTDLICQTEEAYEVLSLFFLLLGQARDQGNRGSVSRGVGAK